MLVASLIVVGLATFLIAPLFAVPEFFPLGGLCFGPFVALIALAVLLRPSPTVVHERGLTVSRPLWVRLAGRREYYPYEEIVNLYPAYYEIAGAVLSPFASSAGTIRHQGLGVDTSEGDSFIVKFTPGRLQFAKGFSQGFRWALEAVEAVYAERGEPMVKDAARYSPRELEAMGELAMRPLLNIGDIFAAFLAPAILVGLFLWVAFELGLAAQTWVVVLALVLAAVPTGLVYAVTYRRARKRSWAVRETSKHRVLQAPPQP